MKEPGAAIHFTPTAPWLSFCMETAMPETMGVEPFGARSTGLGWEASVNPAVEGIRTRRVSVG